MSTTSVPPLDSILGCLFVACILTSVLWGGATVQIVFYYNRYWTSDKWWLKALVLVLWILSTVLQVIDVHYLYTLLIKNYANLLSLTRFDIETDYETMFTAIIDALVQSFFCMRIWHLSAQNCIFTGAAAILITAPFTIQIVYFGLVYQKHYMAQMLSMVAIEKARSITIASTDIFIGFVLVLLLHRNRSDLTAFFISPATRACHVK